MTGRIITALMLLCNISFAQDTLTFMHYNLLNYGNNYGSCNSTNNNVDEKTVWLKTITDHVKPDILTVNEISRITAYHQLLLDNVFNTMGSEFQKASPPNYANSGIMNQVYYRTQKLELLETITIVTTLRDIDIFRFRYRNTTGPDSIFLHCAVAHLKAGNSSEDAERRAEEASRLMNYLSDVNAAGNFTLSGDFNVYSGYEAAYQRFINHPDVSVRFYDPINKTGVWHDNSFYAGIHTQSTHTSGSCHSGGGLDDRFDFILVSDEILNGTHRIRYIENTYEAVGQDGLHFNKSLLSSPQNITVPPDVLDALYNLSDHLPVVCKLYVDNIQSVAEKLASGRCVSVSNPVNDQLVVRCHCGFQGMAILQILGQTGAVLQSLRSPMYPGTIVPLATGNLAHGLYLLRITFPDGSHSVFKFIKQ